MTLVVGADEVAVSRLDRVYWPAERALAAPPVTKRDFLRYLVKASDRMLPHLVDRPLTVFRWPEGIAGRRVLMKHWEIRLPRFVERIDVFSESKGRTDRYIVCNNLATLLWLAQMGALEIHAWHSRIRPGPDTPVTSADFSSSLDALRRSITEHPDYLLFDLDPFLYTGSESRAKQPEFSERAFDRSREVAFWLKDLLDAMNFASFVKTSGKTGLHVVVPIPRTLRYDAVREVARSIGDHLMRAHPHDYRIDTLLRRIDKQSDPWSALPTRLQSLEERLANAGVWPAPAAAIVGMSTVAHARALWGGSSRVAVRVGLQRIRRDVCSPHVSGVGGSGARRCRRRRFA